MPRPMCCICFRRSPHRTISFYKIPEVSHHKTSVRDQEIMKERRNAWLKLLQPNLDRCYGHLGVCSQHFVSGKPAYFLLTKDVDWVPTLKLGDLAPIDLHSPSNADDDESSVMGNDEIAISFADTGNGDEPGISTNDGYSGDETEVKLTLVLPTLTCVSQMNSWNASKVEDCRRTAATLKEVVEFCSSIGLDSPATKTVEELMLFLKQGGSTQLSVDEMPSCSTYDIVSNEQQVDPLLLTYEDPMAAVEKVELLQRQKAGLSAKLDAFDKEETLLRERVALLERSIENQKLVNQIRNNDKMTAFYTGLKTWDLFEMIYQLALPGIKDFSGPQTTKSLSFEEQFLLVLMRLRYNLTEQDLAYRFQISVASMSRHFSKWIDVLYSTLPSHFMVWPSRVANKRSMSAYFKRRFPDCIIIFDCFIVPIQRNVKSRNTVKFLIGITPSGAINYISQGYGRSINGKRSTAMADDLSFLSYLEEGDLVLADRGFLPNKTRIEERGAKLETLPFLGRTPAPPCRETNDSNNVSNVKKHVEGVIARLKEKYKILNGRVSAPLLRKNEDNLSVFDKITLVCCCLINANPSVIPVS